MCFFRKKKEKVRIPEFDKGLLAEAIAFHIGIFDMTDWKINDYKGDITLDNNITLKIDNMFVGRIAYRSYSMNLSIYVENILLATYHFELRDYEDGNICRRWDTIRSELFHEIPYQIINTLNLWSIDTVADLATKWVLKQKREREADELKYKMEEATLKKYW